MSKWREADKQSHYFTLLKFARKSVAFTAQPFPCSPKPLKTGVCRMKTCIKFWDSLSLVHSLPVAAMGETPAGQSGAGGGVRARAAGAPAAAGGRAGCCRRRAPEVSRSRDRAPKRGASVRDGGANDSATGAGEREGEGHRGWCSNLLCEIWAVTRRLYWVGTFCGIVSWRRWQSTTRQPFKSLETCIISPWQHCMRSTPVPWEVWGVGLSLKKKTKLGCRRCWKSNLFCCSPTSLCRPEESSWATKKSSGGRLWETQAFSTGIVLCKKYLILYIHVNL